MTAKIKGTEVFVQLHGETSDKDRTTFIVIGMTESIGDGSRLFVYDSDWDDFREATSRCEYVEAEDRFGYRHEVLSAVPALTVAIFGHCGLDRPLACFFSHRPVELIPDGQYDIVHLDDGALVRYPR